MGVFVLNLLQYGLYGSIVIFAILMVMVIIGGIFQGFGTAFDKLLSIMPGSKRIKDIHKENNDLKNRINILSTEINNLQHKIKQLEEERDNNIADCRKAILRSAKARELYRENEKKLNLLKEKYYQLLGNIVKDNIDKKEIEKEWLNYLESQGIHFTFDFDNTDSNEKSWAELNPGKKLSFSDLTEE